MMTTKPFTVSKSRSRTTFMANDRNHCGICPRTNIKSQLTQLHRVGLHQFRHLGLYLMWLQLLKLTLCCAPCSNSDLFLADHRPAHTIWTFMNFELETPLLMTNNWLFNGSKKSNPFLVNNSYNPKAQSTRSAPAGVAGLRRTFSSPNLTPSQSNGSFNPYGAHNQYDQFNQPQNNQFGQSRHQSMNYGGRNPYQVVSHRKMNIHFKQHVNNKTSTLVYYVCVCQACKLINPPIFF